MSEVARQLHTYKTTHEMLSILEREGIEINEFTIAYARGCAQTVTDFASDHGVLEEDDDE
jgi:hypothetical protein